MARPALRAGGRGSSERLRGLRDVGVGHEVDAAPLGGGDGEDEGEDEEEHDELLDGGDGVHRQADAVVDDVRDEVGEEEAADEVEPVVEQYVAVGGDAGAGDGSEDEGDEDEDLGVGGQVLVALVEVVDGLVLMPHDLVDGGGARPVAGDPVAGGADAGVEEHEQRVVEDDALVGPLPGQGDADGQHHKSGDRHDVRPELLQLRLRVEGVGDGVVPELVTRQVLHGVLVLLALHHGGERVVEGAVLGREVVGQDENDRQHDGDGDVDDGEAVVGRGQARVA
eukprot:765814-Hanusia_phi.AAC.3